MRTVRLTSTIKAMRFLQITVKCIMRRRIYISGALTGADGNVSEENIASFRRAFLLLRGSTGFRIVSPIHVWVCRFPVLYRMMVRFWGKKMAYRLVLLYDLWLLSRCDNIYKIPGWRESKGASIESCVAYHYGIWPITHDLRDKIDKKLVKYMETWNQKNGKEVTDETE